MSQDVVLEVFYPHPPERVWKALTDRRALNAWMMDNDFEACLGHQFQFQRCSPLGQKLTIYCEVLEIEAPKRLVYSWKEHPTSEPSRVTWILAPVEDGTQVQLYHRSEAATSVPGFGISIIDRAARATMNDHFTAPIPAMPPLQPASCMVKNDSHQVLESLNRRTNWHYWLEQRLAELLIQSHL
ncbi:SRPBCC family protein [Adonisia turfae]|uniref:SRPBCC domain-containing protein n=1 Tax=Adonisia turfae CCMR0081 TaxID=2292702 RepID=A0A6M0RL84_9CYAN|nr:SRPBCC domain-containing protein [Adonisia turfae]NEZ56909.1 SRPBCC domain-containing protein [Adonisia turfae CCMR0081]